MKLLGTLQTAADRDSGREGAAPARACGGGPVAGGATRERERALHEIEGKDPNGRRTREGPLQKLR